MRKLVGMEIDAFGMGRVTSANGGRDEKVAALDRAADGVRLSNPCGDGSRPVRPDEISRFGGGFFGRRSFRGESGRRPPEVNSKD